MSENEKNNLKLIVKNQKDLEVISAYIQDSIVTVKDMVFLKKNRIFIMIINRFMWENLNKSTYDQYKRIRAAVKFEDVLTVKSKSINQKNKNKILEYLAMKCDSDKYGNKKIKIFFSGNGLIILILEAISVVLNDLGKPWNVKSIPKHKF